jgi:hypothetical protein
MSDAHGVLCYYAFWKSPIFETILKVYTEQDAGMNVQYNKLHITTDFP